MKKNWIMIRMVLFPFNTKDKRFYYGPIKLIQYTYLTTEKKVYYFRGRKHRMKISIAQWVFNIIELLWFLLFIMVSPLRPHIYIIIFDYVLIEILTHTFLAFVMVTKSIIVITRIKYSLYKPLLCVMVSEIEK